MSQLLPQTISAGPVPIFQFCFNWGVCVLAISIHSATPPSSAPASTGHLSLITSPYSDAPAFAAGVVIT
jgi:hypothetical protein